MASKRAKMTVADRGLYEKMGLVPDDMQDIPPHEIEENLDFGQFASPEDIKRYNDVPESLKFMLEAQMRGEEMTLDKWYARFPSADPRNQTFEPEMVPAHFTADQIPAEDRPVQQPVEEDDFEIMTSVPIKIPWERYQLADIEKLSFDQWAKGAIDSSLKMRLSKERGKTHDNWDDWMLNRQDMKVLSGVRTESFEVSTYYRESTFVALVLKEKRMLKFFFIAPAGS